MTGEGEIGRKEDKEQGLGVWQLFFLSVGSDQVPPVPAKYLWHIRGVQPIIGRSLNITIKNADAL